MALLFFLHLYPKILLEWIEDAVPALTADNNVLLEAVK